MPSSVFNTYRLYTVVTVYIHHSHKCPCDKNHTLFFIFNIKVYNNEFTYDTTYELLYDTTNTVPGGAIYHEYPLAFNINLRNTTKTKYTLRYKVLDINI